MSASPRPQHPQNEFHSISVRPLVRLARCKSVEDVLEHLAEIVTEKGMNLYAVRLVRAGRSREWRPQENQTNDAEALHELEAQVEGGQTRLTLLFAGSITADARCEIEDAAQMAAQRIELCARLLHAKADAKVDPSTPIEGMIGDSGPMQALKQSIRAAARCNSTALIDGESGTGKELAAHAIHRLSSRATGPFIAVNCGAFTEALLESELFGYVKGAFTGAVCDHKGLFEAAHKGTIFLDEIGETTPATQLRLLRVLQERKVRPVGAHVEKEVDVRVIAATNRDLGRAVAEGRFRQDLYYRLHVLTLHVPPLRNHRMDIPLLTDHFLRVIQKRLGFTAPLEIEEEAVSALGEYRWPGNVRELEAMLERLAAESGEANMITAKQVRRETSIAPAASSGGAEIEYVGVLRAGESLDEHFDRQQLMLYEQVRAHVGGNHTRAARWLGMERTALYHRLERARQRTGEGN